LGRPREGCTPLLTFWVTGFRLTDVKSTTKSSLHCLAFLATIDGHGSAKEKLLPSSTATLHCGIFSIRMIQTRSKFASLIEVVSKLQKRQEKCDFQGCKRAVADEIHGALRWRACHASRIAPMLPTPNGIGSNVWFPGPLVRAAPAKMSGKCSMGFCRSCTRGAAGRTCRTTSARRPRLATGGCWSTNAVGSGNAWWRTYWERLIVGACGTSRTVTMTPGWSSLKRGEHRGRVLRKTPD